MLPSFRPDDFCMPISAEYSLDWLLRLLAIERNAFWRYSISSRILFSDASLLRETSRSCCSSRIMLHTSFSASSYSFFKVLACCLQYASLCAKAKGQRTDGL